MAGLVNFSECAGESGRKGLRYCTETSPSRCGQWHGEIYASAAFSAAIPNTFSLGPGSYVHGPRAGPPNSQTLKRWKRIRSEHSRTHSNERHMQRSESLGKLPAPEQGVRDERSHSEHRVDRGRLADRIHFRLYLRY